METAVKTTKQPGINPQWIRQNYLKFWLKYLGYNFESLTDGRVVTKGQLLCAPLNEAFRPVPYEPSEGWESEQEREEHFKMVAQIRKENQVIDKNFE